MLAVLKSCARPGGRPGGIIVKSSRIDFARAPAEPENFKFFADFEMISDVVEEIPDGKIEW